MSRMIGVSDIKRATGAVVNVSGDMVSAIELWERMYRGHPNWEGEAIHSIGLPAAIAGEFARLVTLEMKSEVSGSARADYINEQYTRMLVHLQSQIEQGCALGGMAFKPYPTEDKRLCVDFVPADRFFPFEFDSSGRLTGGVFVDRITRGNRYYTRLEYHQLTGESYVVRNAAYMSYNKDSIGIAIPLHSVSQWEGLADEVEISGIVRPLFGYFRVPLANNVDRNSPLGVSVYARAVDLIRQADEQWSRLLWEFEGTELAVDISDRAFKLDEKTGNPIIPKHWRRLFRAHQLGSADTPLYQVFSPEIREAPLYKGLQDILQRIEFNCGLAYGTLSDPQTVEKTAEEIKTSKQRSYSTVSALQTALQFALEDVVYAMDVWTSLNRLAPAGKYETSFSWDDSIIVDTDKEFSQRMQMTTAGLIRPEITLAWYFGCSEDEARKMMPEQKTEADLLGLSDA